MQLFLCGILEAERGLVGTATVLEAASAVQAQEERLLAPAHSSFSSSAVDGVIVRVTSFSPRRIVISVFLPTTSSANSRGRS